MASECTGKQLFHHAGKNQWPELLNVTGEVAKTTIERENPSVTAYIIDEDAIVIQDFRCDRVWVRVNTYGVVTRIPKIG
ncbi:proteinase inhibitor-like [Magnolia sinica]|uniref:proteinase inhibitor-like n=1 Tax=Magnolia sinica TaxID=86752 RepID=UPI00265A7FB6|nr:proteinase inhibitor-like [Magnolia sinica]